MPLTKVPLALPESVTTHPCGAGYISACCRLTDGSLRTSSRSFRRPTRKLEPNDHCSPSTWEWTPTNEMSEVDNFGFPPKEPRGSALGPFFAGYTTIGCF